jgi:hypothetical protein
MQCPIGIHEGACAFCLCEHGRKLFDCIDCNIVVQEYAYCVEHDKATILCLECIPSFKCQHGEHKALCGICPYLCVHNEDYLKCVQCRIVRSCEHGNQMRTCNICKNVRRFCKHGAEKKNCLTCPTLPTSKCKEHGKVRIFCDACNPELSALSLGYCEHGSLKVFCLECNPAVKCLHGCYDGLCSCMCEHGNKLFDCIDCNIVIHEYDPCVEHDKATILCLECIPSFKCQHGEHKALCAICPSLCIHNKDFRDCYCYIAPKMRRGRV